MRFTEMLTGREQLLDDQAALLNKAKLEKRGLSSAEEAEYQMIERRVARYEEELREREGIPERTGNFNDDYTHWQREEILSRQPRFSGRSSSAYYGRTGDNLTALEARYIRTADPAVLAELRASNNTDMNIGTPADGGYAVPTGHYQNVITKMRPKALPFQLGVMEVPGKGTIVNVPVDNTTGDGAFVLTPEVGTFDTDAPALTQVPLQLVKYSKQIQFSVELLEDEDSRLMDFVNTYIADGMAATLNSLLVTEVLSSGTAGLTAASPTAIAAADIPNLLYKLKAEYMAGNVSWLMNRTVEGYIRGLVGNAFQFAPTPAGRTGSSSELFGVPVATTSYMPTQAASAKTVVIGNWSRMGIRLAPNLSILNDPFTLGHLGQVRLLCFFRTDIEVLTAEAFQYLTQST